MGTRRRRTLPSRTCLECGTYLPQKREAAYGEFPAYLCSIDCRDARQTRHMCGEPQYAKGECFNVVRKGHFVQDENYPGVWFVMGLQIRPGFGMSVSGETRTSYDLDLYLVAHTPQRLHQIRFFRLRLEEAQ